MDKEIVQSNSFTWVSHTLLLWIDNRLLDGFRSMQGRAMNVGQSIQGGIHYLKNFSG